jgi:alanine dehydrogenase
MRVGVPKEVKIHEYRVSLTPAGARELAADGHQVYVQSGAGAGVGYDDADYQNAGAHILPTREEVFGATDLVVKVKEPQLEECALLTESQVLFTYLHLAADPAQAAALCRSNATAIAYETVTDEEGGLPLLTPMSEVAGRMSIQVGARCLEKSGGGAGTLLGGIPGVLPARVLIIGGGVSGTSAARMALGLGAQVTVLESSIKRMRQLDDMFQGRIQTHYSTRSSIEENVRAADLIVGAVLSPGAAAPKLVSRDLVKAMKSGAAIVDIAIDQGGCFETSRPTTHADPTYIEHGVVHYCVTNMPGAVARTSTLALTNVTLPYIRKLAASGYRKAVAADEHLGRGLNIQHGEIMHPAVAHALRQAAH